MPTTITGSNYITSLDSAIMPSFCDGNFHVDVSPSIFINGGQAYVAGASVEIKNHLGIVIKAYSTSGYDIEPPMTTVVEYPIPLVAGNYLYGTYTFTVRLIDENDVAWTVVKTVNICPPDKKNKNKKTACLNSKIIGDCVNGKVRIALDAPANYKGLMFDSQVNDLTLLYPTESELPPLETVIDAFSVQLYEGEYKLSGTVCATYIGEDNISYEVLFDVKCSKIIKCSIDKCCVNAKLIQLNARLKTDCSQEEKDKTSSIIFDSLRLLTSIDYAAFCGDDPSDLISELEDLLECICTCNCNDGTPIINNAPAEDFDVTGCNVTKTTVGLTTTYDIENYNYDLDVVDDDETGILEVISTTLNDCTKSLRVNLVKEAILSLFTADNGLRKNTSSNFRLGGALVENTTIGASNNSLSILNDVHIGIQHPNAGDNPKVKVNRGISAAISEAIGATIWGQLYMNNLSSLGSVDDYAGLFGMIAIESVNTETGDIEHSYAGTKGRVLVNSDDAVTAFLASIVADSAFQSFTVGAYGTHGKLTKYAGLRVIGPRQIQSTSTQEFGGIEDSYGAYIESMGGDIPERITRTWGMYQVDDADNNFLASTLKVGGTDTIAASAQLEVTSTTKGLLLPRMTKVQRDAIVSPVAGLMIYQTDNTPGLRTFNGTNWMRYTETID